MQKSKSIAGKILFAVFVIVFVGIIVLPFFWQFMTSIKPLSEISAIPAKWIPSKVHWDFYKNVFTKHPFGRYLLNSFIVALSTTVLSILIGASAAYALARLRFKGKKINLKPDLSSSEKPEASQYICRSDHSVHHLCPAPVDLASDELFCTASEGI